jgi:ribosomal-protein-alanine N-acetyltransferase
MPKDKLYTRLPLETERLLLKSLSAVDAELITQYVNDNKPHLTPWEPIRPAEYYTIEFWRKTIKKYNQEPFGNQALRFILFLKTTPAGPVIGMCNFNNIIRGAFQACHLGYSIDYRYQRQGLMYEALKKATDFAFEHVKLHRIMANYMPKNERSGKLLRKLGFVPEGYARDYLKIAGKWEDHILTSLVRT